MDRYSPLAPAFVRVLVLPVGQFERKRFLPLVEGLKQEASIIQLKDVGPHCKGSDLLLSPEASPRGCLFYNYTTSVPSEHLHHLSPYELFREPLLVIGLVDGLGDNAGSGLQELGEAARYLREKHQRVVHRQLLVIGTHEHEAPEDAVHISEHAFDDQTLLRDALLKVSASFLTELSTYTRALQASPSITTPGQTARSLQRSASTREKERIPPSGRSTPTQTSDAGSPVSPSGVRTPPYGRNSPATSFDQIATNAQNAMSRSESRANRIKHGGRAGSQDRASASGFGSLSQEKLKNRGKARVGIVTGYLYMMAGQWAEALKILNEGTHKARQLSDFLWHAKGMEGLVVCLLLHAWAGIDFQIPTLCYSVGDRASSQRFSLNTASDFRTAEAAQKAALHKLSNYLPDLIKQILDLYDSGEASLELPFLVISEATIRCCKLLLLLRRNVELSPDALDLLVRKPGVPSTTSTAAGTASKVSSNIIANMLADAQPHSEDNVPLPDQVSILAGVASVYSALGMKRKRAVVMREMVVKLTHALLQARKRGAAEAGIHPAATLSADNGADAVLSAMELDSGLHQMLEDVAASFGATLTGQDDEHDISPQHTPGNDRLKQLVLNELSAFCEASPDLQGLLRVNTALLSTSSCKTVASDTNETVEGLSRETQERLTSTINRSVGVARHLGLPKLEAHYWDPFLVREVTFLPLDNHHALVERANVPGGIPSVSQLSSANPLLYDPSASRPGTAAGAKAAPVTVVQGERATCVVKLQNPYEVQVDIDSISVVTEGAELAAKQEAIKLGPLRVQEVPISFVPTSTGDCKVTDCRVKVSGYEERDFPIYKTPWALPAPLLIKNAGQEAGVLPIDRPTPPASETVAVTVLAAQPLLTIEKTSMVEDGVMLLDGESVEVEVVLRNDSDTAASIIELVTSNGMLTSQVEVAGVSMEPGTSKSFKLSLHGKTGFTNVQMTIIYERRHDSDEGSRRARVLQMPVNVTINPSLQLQNPEIWELAKSDRGATGLTLSLDIGNAWPKSLDYECSTTGFSSDDGSRAKGTLAPGEIHRLFLPLQRPNLPHSASIETLRGALIGTLTGNWHGDGRKGRVDFSKLRPSAETLELLRREPVSFQLDLVGPGDASARNVEAGSFVTVRARIASNGASSGSPLLVSVHPRTQPGVDASIEERRFAVSGSQHKILPPLAAGKEAYADFALCPLLAGDLELDVTVRPAQMLRQSKADGAEWVVQRSLRMRVV